MVHPVGGKGGGGQEALSQLTAPQDPQVLDAPSLEAPHLGQLEPCMFATATWGFWRNGGLWGEGCFQWMRRSDYAERLFFL